MQSLGKKIRNDVEDILPVSRQMYSDSESVGVVLKDK